MKPAEHLNPQTPAEFRANREAIMTARGLTLERIAQWAQQRVADRTEKRLYTPARVREVLESGLVDHFIEGALVDLTGRGVGLLFYGYRDHPAGRSITWPPADRPVAKKRRGVA